MRSYTVVLYCTCTVSAAHGHSKSPSFRIGKIEINTQAKFYGTGISHNFGVRLEDVCLSYRVRIKWMFSTGFHDGIYFLPHKLFAMMNGTIILGCYIGSGKSGSEYSETISYYPHREVNIASGDVLITGEKRFYQRYLLWEKQLFFIVDIWNSLLTNI